MRRSITLLAVLLIVAGPVFAQRGRGGGRAFVPRPPVQAPGAGFGSILHPGGVAHRTGAGFGSILFPGATHPPGMITDTTFAQRLHSTVSGMPLHHQRAFGFGQRGFGFGQRGLGFGRGRGGFIGGGGIMVGMPAFIGSGYDYGYGYIPPYAQPAFAGAPQAQPQIVIHQTFIGQTPAEMRRNGEAQQRDGSGVSIYRAPSREEGDAAPQGEESEAAQGVELPAGAESAGPRRYYLIAYKDHLVETAVGYWVDGQTLHYLTPDNLHRAVPVSAIDRATTQKLNPDRFRQVRLPEED
jgi:hypothetical protein